MLDARRRAGLSQAEVGRIIGDALGAPPLSQQHVGLIERRVEDGTASRVERAYAYVARLEIRPATARDHLSVRGACGDAEDDMPTCGDSSCGHCHLAALVDGGDQ